MENLINDFNNINIDNNKFISFNETIINYCKSKNINRIIYTTIEKMLINFIFQNIISSKGLRIFAPH